MVPSSMQLRRRYRELSMPVSIVAGTHDRVVTTERPVRAAARRASVIAAHEGERRGPHGSSQRAGRGTQGNLRGRFRTSSGVANANGASMKGGQKRNGTNTHGFSENI